MIDNSSTICDTIPVNELMSRYSKQHCKVKGDIVYFSHFDVSDPTSLNTDDVSKDEEEDENAESK